MINYKLRQEPPRRKNLPATLAWLGKYWFQVTVSFFLVHLYFQRDVKVQVQSGLASPAQFSAQKIKAAVAIVPAEEAAELSVGSLEAVAEVLLEDKPPKPASKWKSSDFRNLSFVFDPDMARRKGVDDAIVEEKMETCRSYVERFAATAMSEMKQFGIPASITLAQGLLETDAGESGLATDSNNHFGIKCRSKCRGCTCRNYSDDDVYDMFRVFNSAWESFREHSELLSNGRYKHLKELGTQDYEGWAAGLKKAGYATDKNYDRKLVRIIEGLDLAQFDK